MLFKDNHDALSFWQRVAGGDLDAETIERLKEVAYEIAQEVFEKGHDPAARRAEAALQSVGWAGRSEKYPGLKDLALKELQDMSPTDVAAIGGLVLPDLPKEYDEKVAAKSVRAYRSRK